MPDTAYLPTRDQWENARKQLAERDAEIRRLQGDVKRLAYALEHAELFIKNGCELGYIRLPAGDDPALLVPGIIESALSLHKESEHA